MIGLGAHVFATILLIICKYEEESWIKTKNLNESSIGIQYIEALYFAIITMVTVFFIILIKIGWIWR